MWIWWCWQLKGPWEQGCEVSLGVLTKYGGVHRQDLPSPFQGGCDLTRSISVPGETWWIWGLFVSSPGGQSWGWVEWSYHRQALYYDCGPKTIPGEPSILAELNTFVNCNQRIHKVLIWIIREIFLLLLQPLIRSLLVILTSLPRWGWGYSRCLVRESPGVQEVAMATGNPAQPTTKAPVTLIISGQLS